MTAVIAPTVPAPVPAGPAAETGTLLAVLASALVVVAEEEPETFSTRTPAGTAVTSLSAIARRAAARLGADPGVHLTDGPGVVVVRDLVSATRLLSRALDRSGMACGPDRELTAAAQVVHATLRDLLTPAR